MGDERNEWRLEGDLWVLGRVKEEVEEQEADEEKTELGQVSFEDMGGRNRFFHFINIMDHLVSSAYGVPYGVPYGVS